MALDGLPDEIDALDWVSGKIMDRPAEDLIVDLSLESGDYRGHIIDGFATLYHESLKEALDSLGVDNILYFPVRLRHQDDGSTEGGYLLTNIIGLLDCVDMAKSKVKYWPSGMGFDFLSMAIDETKTNGAKIFRLKDDPTKVIINQELKDYFDRTDMLVGVILTQAEDYSDW